jgi:hypothetical protein
VLAASEASSGTGLPAWSGFGCLESGSMTARGDDIAATNEIPGYDKDIRLAGK